MDLHIPPRHISVFNHFHAGKKALSVKVTLFLTLEWLYNDYFYNVLSFNGKKLHPAIDTVCPAGPI